jgi:hypothetical protein
MDLVFWSPVFLSISGAFWQDGGLAKETLPAVVTLFLFFLANGSGCTLIYQNLVLR